MNTLDVKIILTGGLGNQIFQYLAGQYLISILPHLYVSYEPSEYIKRGFRELGINKLYPNANINIAPYMRQGLVYRYLNRVPKVVAEILASTFPYLGNCMTIAEHSIDQGSKSSPLTVLGEYVERFDNRSRRNYRPSRVIVDGYWQNLKPYIEQAIHPIPPLYLWRGLAMPAWAIPNAYISLHIRRGDYVHDVQASIEFGKAYDVISFIRKSLAIVPPSLLSLPLVIVTDDPYWSAGWAWSECTRQFAAVHIVSSEPIRDWLILTNSRLNIISNSTFSSSAAFLNQANACCKLRCIMPNMFSRNISIRQKNWHLIDGSLVI